MCDRQLMVFKREQLEALALQLEHTANQLRSAIESTERNEVWLSDAKHVDLIIESNEFLLREIARCNSSNSRFEFDTFAHRSGRPRRSRRRRP